MIRKIYPIWLILIFFLTAASSHLNLPPLSEDTPVPPGFYLIDASIGWELYRKDYQEGNPDFVQVIRLDKGAGIELKTGDIAKSGSDRGGYGGDNPKFFNKSLADFWWDISNRNPNTLCITNGSFFYLPEYPTKLAFPLKVDGKIITDGFGIETYPWQKLILELWDDKADIRRLTRWNLQTSNAPDIIAGLAEDANKKAKNYTGRTFIGIDDRDMDGIHETILIFNTLTARQVDAANTLYNFGADKLMMLDGGGSTQLICKGEEKVETERLIPQVLAVTRGDGPLFSGRVLDSPDHPIMVEGEETGINITLENNGAESWRPDNGYIFVDNGPGASTQKFPLDRIILPGDTLNISWKIDPGNNSGDISSNFYIVQGSQRVLMEPGDIKILFLPRKSENKVKEVASKLGIYPKNKPTESSAIAYNQINHPIEAENPPPSGKEVVIESDLNEDDYAVTVILIPFTIIIVSGLIMARIKSRNSNF